MAVSIDDALLYVRGILDAVAKAMKTTVPGDRPPGPQHLVGTIRADHQG